MIAKRRLFSFANSAVVKWREEEGLEVRLNYNVDIRKFPELIDTAKLVGAMALDYNNVCKHMYEIFATPSFMAGGFEGFSSLNPHLNAPQSFLISVVGLLYAPTNLTQQNGLKWLSARQNDLHQYLYYKLR